MDVRSLQECNGTASNSTRGRSVQSLRDFLNREQLREAYVPLLHRLGGQSRSGLPPRPRNPPGSLRVSLEDLFEINVNRR